MINKGDNIMFRNKINNSIIMSGSGKVIVNGEDLINDDTDLKEINIVIQDDVINANANDLTIEGNVVNAKAGNNLNITGNVTDDYKASNNIYK